MQSTTADALLDKLKTVLDYNSLKFENIVGSCMDGAANMRGKYNGLQAKIRKLSPKAIYTYCYAHQFNLAIEKSCEQLNYIRNMIDNCKTLYDFVEGSAQRHCLFQHIQDENKKTTLKNFKRMQM